MRHKRTPIIGTELLEFRSDAFENVKEFALVSVINAANSSMVAARVTTRSISTSSTPDKFPSRRRPIRE